MPQCFLNTLDISASVQFLLSCTDRLVHGRGAKDSNSDMNMYGRTKLFNIMSSTEFNRRLKGTGVESFSCHPGVAKTDLYHPDKMDKDKLSSKVRGILLH